MKKRIWDNFTRIYHMSQLILLALLWYSGEQADFELHFICGYLLLSLWVSRIVWGFIGSDTSKFVRFIRSPQTAVKHIKHAHKPHVGHNPIAGYMVLALLAALGVQLLTGLFATDDVLAEGPLLYYVSDSLAETLDSLHNSNFDILLILIGLHVIAALVHTFKADNVIKTIITGKSENEEASDLKFKSSLIPLVLWVILFSLFAYLWLGEIGL